MAITGASRTSGWGASTINPVTTASIAPTAGATLFAFVILQHLDGTDPYDAESDFTITGLGGTWVEVASEMTGSEAWALFSCSDWSGSGSLTVTYTGPGSIARLGWMVDEVLGLSSVLPYFALTRSTAGRLNTTFSPYLPVDLVIGKDTVESVPTNAATMSWCFVYDNSPARVWTSADYDSANFVGLTFLNEEADNQLYGASIISVSGDTTPEWYSGVTGRIFQQAIGLILVADGDEPAEYRERMLVMNESKFADNVSPSTFPNWSRFEIIAAGLPMTDSHTDHAPSARVIDMTATGYYRMMVDTQIGSDDHWVSAVWFPDKDTSGAQQNVLDLMLRHQDGIASSDDDGYRVVFRKRNVVADQYDIWVESVVDQVGTTLASVSSITVPNVNDGFVCLAEIIGSVIKVWTDGVLRLTHDTTGDVTRYTTGQYVGVGQHRLRGATDSQPFFYRWQSGIFTEPDVGGVTYEETLDTTVTGSTTLTDLAVRTETLDTSTAATTEIVGVGTLVEVTDTTVSTSTEITDTLVPAGAPPDAVDDLAGTAGDGQVTLTWTPPADNGSPITDYVVQYREAL